MSSFPILSAAAFGILFTRSISSISTLYLCAISDSVSHLETLWMTHEIGGILSTIPGLSVSLREISFAHSIASMLIS
jgi:uncharacterized membrane protein